MESKSKDLLKEALGLPAVERARLVDELLSSLDTPDKSIDDVWRKEIAARLDAYRTGKASTVSAEDVLAEYRRR